MRSGHRNRDHLPPSEQARPPDTIALYEEGPDRIQRFIGESALTGDGYVGQLTT